jgi:predicted lipoprotein with Yx(FWY)xxD motif
MWRPAAAPAHPKVFGEWSVIKRAGGVKQWAWHGKPLYTSVKDVDPGSVFGNSPVRFGPKRKTALGEIVGGLRHGGKDAADAPLPAGWSVARLFPVSDVKLPAEITVREIQDASALVLVNYRNMALYAFADDPQKDAKTKNLWRPAEASQLAGAVGDFGLIARDDGVRQWTYKNKGLYTYAGDVTADDANGIGVDKQMKVAALYTYYRPPQITVQATLAQGKVVATAAGLTLYRRDAHIEQTGGGHGFRRGQPMRPAVGRDIGIDHVGCDEACLKTWHPYLAPADAQAWGQWNVAVRPDGKKQWVYQGYPLWTYDGDKKPGEIAGNDSYDLIYADAPGTIVQG